MKNLEIIGPFEFGHPNGDDVPLWELCTDHRPLEDFATYGYAVSETAAQEIVRRVNLHEELVAGIEQLWEAYERRGYGCEQEMDNLRLLLEKAKS